MNRPQPGAKSSSINRYLFLGITLCLGLTVSILLSLKVYELEQNRLQVQFSRIANNCAEQVRRSILSGQEVLQSIASLYASRVEIGRQEFHTFVQDALERHPEIQMLGWAPRVIDSQRARFEKEIHPQGSPNFRISERDLHGVTVRAGQREEYFPATYVEPLDRNKETVGFDHASVPIQREAMAIARDLGEPIATDRIQFSRSDLEENNSYGFLIFLPIYRNEATQESLEARRKNLIGFGVAVYQLDHIMESALRRFDYKGIRIGLYDGIEETAPLLYETRREGASSRERQGLLEKMPFVPSLVPWQSTLNVAGRRWLFVATPMSQFLSGREQWGPWTVLLFGFLFTALLCGTLSNIMSRTSLIELIVAERTRELSQANSELGKREKQMQTLVEKLNTSHAKLEQQAGALQQANKRLQEAAVMKDEFVAKVSHELRTPLTSIKEGLNLIIDGALGSVTLEQKDFLTTMDADINRLADLINNMLDISKVESGRMKLQRRRIRITDVIRSVIRNRRAVSGKWSIVENFEACPDVFVDANRMFQVFENLFSNAMKYGKEKGKIAFIVEQRNGDVAISIQDEGEGISPEDQSKLFHKFSQVGRRDAARPRGTGLGLVVCKEFVELHGGRIEVASQIGRGTTFTVLLPAYTDAWALRESFLDILLEQYEKSKEEKQVGLIAIEAHSLSDGEAQVRRSHAPGGVSGAASDSRSQLEKIAEGIRRRLHQGDTVLTVDPGWIVILAACDSRGLEAIVHRLRQTLSPEGYFRFGAAFYPTDGQDVTTLLEHATHRLNEERSSMENAPGHKTAAGEIP